MFYPFPFTVIHGNEIVDLLVKEANIFLPKTNPPV